MQAVSLKKRQTIYNAKTRKAGYKKKKGTLVGYKRQWKNTPYTHKPSPITTKYSFDPNSPFGDKAVVKLRFNYAGTMAGDGITSFVSGSISLNDLSAIYSYAQSISKGYLTYPKLFNRYRVTGCAVKFTSAATRTAPVPFLFFLLPWTSDEGAPTSTMKTASTIKQQRWATVGYTAPYSTGSPVQATQTYVDIKNLWGDKMVNQSIAWTAVTDLVGNPYNSPTQQANMTYGFCSMSEGITSVSDTFTYNLEMVYTVEFFEQKHEQQYL